MKSTTRFLYYTGSLIIGLAVILGLFYGFSRSGVAQAAPGSQVGVSTQGTPLRPIVFTSSKNDTSPPLRDLVATVSQFGTEAGPKEIPFMALPKAKGGATGEGTTGILQDWMGPEAMPTPIANFEGVNNVNGVLPPDTNGDIGYDPATGTKYYMQWNNLSLQVWDVTDPASPTTVLGPANGNTLFTGFGGVCETTNDGDPIVLYDPFDNRWMASQFALPNFPNGPFYQCVAVSQSGDPTGSWNRYEFTWPVNKMNDYPKFGVWEDAYYMTANQFNAGSLSWGGQGVAALERTEMVAGNPAQIVYFDLFGVNSNFGGMLPADLDGPPPPSGTPGYFIEWDDGTWIPPNDAVRLWEFVVDWVTPANSTFGVSGQPNVTITTADVDPDMCGFARNCIPQPGGSALDAISDRLMYRAQYRDFGSYAALVSNHTVDVDGTDHAGIYWFELRDTGGGWSMYQEGVYAPDSDHRWMGSIAMDHVGNIALGYSVSSSSTFPSIRYDGRLTTDPLGTLPQGETTLIAGSGYQQHSSGRWGDYSMMGVDPQDDCTFWYTQEYYATIGSAPWQTRIGSFKFPSCSIGAQGTLSGTVTDSSTSLPIAGARVEATASITQTGSATTGPNGDYAMPLLVGTYTVTASAFGYQPSTVTGVGIVSGTTTVQDFALTPGTSYVVSGTVTDALTGWPLYAHISISGDPIDPPPPLDEVWTDPVTGYYSLTLPEAITYTFSVDAWVPGYLTGGGTVGPLTGDTTADFGLDADPATCSAPGYGFDVIFYDGFETGTLGPSWTITTTNQGRVQVDTSDPYAGSYSVLLDDTTGDTTYSIAGIILSQDMSSESAATLSFWWHEYGDENDPEDGVFISDDGGATWCQVFSFNNGPSSYINTVVDLTAALPGCGMSFTSNFQILFQGYDNFPIPSDGYTIDEVFLTRGGALSCVVSPGGLVVGNVYDANTGGPLVGAGVDNDSGESTTAMATPADPAVDDAFYTLFSPAGSHVFTATMSGGYSPDIQTPTVVQSDTIRQDFNLGAGWLVASPTSLQATLGLGDVLTQTLTLTNQGNTAAGFAFLEQDGGFNPAMPVSLLPSDGNFPRGDAPVSIERAPQGSPLKTNQDGAGMSFPLAGEPAFGIDLLASNLVYIPDTTVPGTWNIIANLGSAAYFAGDFINGDFTTLYALDYNTNQLYAVDTATGVATLIGPSPTFGGEAWAGMTGATDGTMYASSTDITRSTLYTIDLATGTPTVVGQITNAPCIIDIAINASGEMYGVDICTDVLVQIDPASGAGTVIGPIGFDANYAQGMDFEEVSGVLYLAAYNNALSQGELRIADPATGNSTLVGPFPGGTETDALAFETGGGGPDVPWLAENPITGTITAGLSMPIDIFFDAGVPEVTQPGEYYATLEVTNDTPYGDLMIPVTMTVTAPPNFGKLDGTVTSLGYCDANPTPADGADVLVEATGGMTWTLVTDSSGYYSLWLDEAGSPLTVTVTYPDHLMGMATGVNVTGGVTTTVDFGLRWLQPCVSTNPDAYDVTVALGYSQTSPLTLTNAGALSTTFQLTERDLGFTPGMLRPEFAGQVTVVQEDKAAASELQGPAPVPLAGGGPDPFGYIFRDSNEPDGPVYNWIEIAPPAGGSGLSAGLNGVDDGYVFPVTISFPFNFYGTDYTDLAFASNGTVYFEDNYLGLGNTPIPGTNSYGVFTFIAHYWDDLVVDPGEVYYLDMGDMVIIEYYRVRGFGTSGDDGIWQVILFDNGNILFQYQDATIGGTRDYGAEATIGIQGDTATGLQYSYNTASLSDGLAICFAYPGNTPDCAAGDVPWLNEVPITGTIDADSSQLVDIIFDTTVLTQTGRYSATLTVRSDDPVSGSIEIPVVMTVITPTFGVDLSPDAALTGAPGDTVTYTLSITNTGNAPDTFDLVASGETWTTTLSLASIDLDPGAVGTFTVWVEIPASAADGATDTVTITATSQTDPAASDTSDLTTTAVIPGYFIYIPFVPKN